MTQKADKVEVMFKFLQNTIQEKVFRALGALKNDLPTKGFSEEEKKVLIGLTLDQIEVASQEFIEEMRERLAKGKKKVSE